MASQVPLAVDSGWRKQGAWLYSARADLGIVLTPCFVVAAVALMAVGEAGVSERAYGTWFSQFVLGNSTHVMLGFCSWPCGAMCFTPPRGTREP